MNADSATFCALIDELIASWRRPATDEREHEIVNSPENRERRIKARAALEAAISELRTHPAAQPAQPVAGKLDTLHAANQCVDAAVLFLLGEREWPEGVMPLRDQFASIFRAAAASPPPSPKTGEGSAIGRVAQVLGDPALADAADLRADTGQSKHPGNCWNVRCQLGGVCCRADDPTTSAEDQPNGGA